MAREVYLLPVDHDPFKPGVQGEDEEARAFAAPAMSSSLEHYRGIGSDRAADRSPRAPAEVLDQYPFANALAGGLVGMSALPRIAHTMVKEGIDTADRWLSATRQLPGAKATDDLVLPIEDRGTEKYQLNPNRIEQHDVLAPLGLAGMGSPVSALGRETLRAGAKVGRPSESYSPSLGDRAMAKYLEQLSSEPAVRPGPPSMEGVASGLPSRIDLPTLRDEVYWESLHNPKQTKAFQDMDAMLRHDLGDETPQRLPANDPERLRLLSNAEDNRSSLPGMIANAAGREVDSLGFYSQALEAAKALKQERGTPEQMRAQLRNAGVKEAELQAVGLDDLLSGKSSITKAEIVKHLEGNRVEVGETAYASGKTKWATYSLDKGKNPTYRETVLSLPPAEKSARETAVEGRIAALQKESQNVLTPPARTREIEAELKQLWNEQGGLLRSRRDADFHEGHWDGANVIAHARTSMQKDLRGRNVFHVDELQSDWGQEIRDRKGARDPGKVARIERDMQSARSELKTAGDEARDWLQRKVESDVRPAGFGLFGRRTEPGPHSQVFDTWMARQGVHGAKTLADVPAHEVLKLIQDGWWNPPAGLVERLKSADAADRRLSAELLTAKAQVVGHPLVNTTDQWTTTALRRLLRQAVDSGSDAIAIPAGKTVDGYGMGGKPEGNKAFYEGIVPRNLEKVLSKIDPRIKPAKTSLKGHESKEPFTVFYLTPEAKEAIKGGMALFANQDRASTIGAATNAFNSAERRGDRSSGAANASDALKRISNPIRVYHGSPHDFDKFDSSKIGTGEGAQAFGHGLYFAEKPSTAQHYKEALSGAKAQIGGRPVYGSESPAHDLLLKNGWDVNKAAAEASELVNRFSTTDKSFTRRQQAQDALDTLNEWKETGAVKPNPGRLYEVSLHATPDQFLDWDLPLSKQSEGVRKAFGDLFEANKVPAGLRQIAEKNKLGDAMETLGFKNARGSDVSEKLRALGITGIRYKDQGSRGKDGGTYNYVVFPGADDVIEIIGKDGKPLQGAEKAKAVKDLYARQGLPVPGEDETKERRVYLVPVDHDPFKKTAAVISPGERPGPARDVYLGETPADTQQRQYNEHLKRLFEADAAAPYGPDALVPEMGARMPILDPHEMADRRGMQQHLSPRTRTLRPF